MPGNHASVHMLAEHSTAGCVANNRQLVPEFWSQQARCSACQNSDAEWAADNQNSMSVLIEVVS